MITDSSILIIGGAGFVGSGLLRRILPLKPKRVVVVDNLMSSEEGNIPKSPLVTFKRASFSDAQTVQSLKDEFDAIYHLATYHGNENSIADALADHENSLLPTLLLFDHVKYFKRLRRLIYVSTGCSLSQKGISEEPVIESDRASLDFDSPYQISKITGEMYALYYRRLYNLPVVRVRFQNVYGPGEVLGAGVWRGTPATVWRNVVPVFTFLALHGQKLKIYGDGSSARDFIYIDDIAEGLIRCLTTQAIEGEVFNLASGECVPIIELAKTINELTGNEAEMEFLPQRSWDRSIQRFGCTKKSKQILGFQTSVSLSAGISETVRWTKENLQRIYASIKKHEKHYKVSFLS